MPIENQGTPSGDITLERPVSGKPHGGKVLAAVQPHADDIPLFCGGTIAKLIEEGYTGYLIQTTNDEKCGPTPSIGETVLSNEREVDDLHFRTNPVDDSEFDDLESLDPEAEAEARLEELKRRMGRD